MVACSKLLDSGTREKLVDAFVIEVVNELLAELTLVPAIDRVLKRLETIELLERLEAPEPVTLVCLVDPKDTPWLDVVLVTIEEALTLATEDALELMTLVDEEPTEVLTLEAELDEVATLDETLTEELRVEVDSEMGVVVTLGNEETHEQTAGALLGAEPV